MELKKLVDSNKERTEAYYASHGRHDVPNGIECPVCKLELVDTDPNRILCSCPAQVHVRCLKCGYIGTRVI